jgi:hypothetical protein
LPWRSGIFSSRANSSCDSAHGSPGATLADRDGRMPRWRTDVRVRESSFPDTNWRAGSVGRCCWCEVLEQLAVAKLVSRDWPTVLHALTKATANEKDHTKRRTSTVHGPSTSRDRCTSYVRECPFPDMSGRREALIAVGTPAFRDLILRARLRSKRGRGWSERDGSTVITGSYACRRRLASE